VSVERIRARLETGAAGMFWATDVARVDDVR
jgi:hypothetical protein